MKSHDSQDAAPARKLTRWASVIFFVLAVVNFALGRWLEGAFLLATGVFFLKATALDRMPKAAGVMLLLAYLALGVATIVNMIYGYRTHG